MKPKDTKKGKGSRGNSLERLYKQLFETTDTTRVAPDNQSLVQPTPYLTTPTFTTYSAYEDPI